MSPVDVHADCRGKYVEHMGKYDFLLCLFPSLSSPVLCNEKQHVYQRMGDDDNEVTHPLRVSSTLVPDVDLYCSNVMVYSTTPPLGTLVDWSGDS